MGACHEVVNGVRGALAGRSVWAAVGRCAVVLWLRLLWGVINTIIRLCAAVLRTHQQWLKCSHEPNAEQAEQAKVSRLERVEKGQPVSRLVDDGRSQVVCRKQHTERSLRGTVREGTSPVPLATCMRRRTGLVGPARHGEAVDH